MAPDLRPLVAHVMYRFDTGGLENGVVNLVNHMADDRYRHAIVALTDVTEFRQRVRKPGVEFHALHKPPGHGVWQYPRLFRLFRKLRPAIVHSRNLAALETQVPAWAAGVPVRIHGEHGRDVGDLDGNNKTYQRVRRIYRPFVQHYVALSRDLAAYVGDKVHVPPVDVTQIYNGVDSQHFRPAEGTPVPIDGCPFAAPEHWLVGTVGRMQAVKDQLNLVRAFVLALQAEPGLRKTMRLVLVGDGPLRAQCLAELQATGLAELAWLPGARSDVPALMRGLQCFVLPSLAEGISNTILEAMACGLPVIATNVGGNADLVESGRTGEIVPAGDPQALAQSLRRMALAPAQAARMGMQGRAVVEQRFDLPAMVAAYQALYDRMLAKAQWHGQAR